MEALLSLFGGFSILVILVAISPILIWLELRKIRKTLNIISFKNNDINKDDEDIDDEE